MRWAFVVMAAMSACTDLGTIDPSRAEVVCPEAHSEDIADVAEPDECMVIAHEASTGVAISRTIQPAGDVDWTRFAVTPGHIYVVSASGNRPLELQVFDHRGTLQSGADGAALVFAESDALYASVRGADPKAVCRYTIRAEDVGADDFPNAFTASVRGHTSSVSGSLQYAGDVDFVPFQFGVGRSFELAALGLGGDQRFTVIALDGGTGDFDYLFGDIATPDFFTVKVRGDVGAYTIQVLEIGIDDHSGIAPFGTRLVPGSHVYGQNVIDLNDMDLFWTDELLPSHLYFVRSAAQSLVVLDEKARLASSNRVFALRDGGTFVRVAGNDGPYSLELVDLGPDDFGDTTLDAGILVPGVPLNGRLELSTDIDVFTFRVQQNHFYSLTLEAPDAGRVSLSRLDSFFFAVPDAGEGLWRARRTGDEGAQVVSTRGAYTSYRLTLDALGADDHPDLRPAATVLPLDGGASGVVHSTEDIDTFAVDAPVGTIVQFDVIASPDTSARILNENGTQLTWNMIADGSRLGFLTGTTRTFVEVRAPAVTPFTITAFVGVDSRRHPARSTIWETVTCSLWC